MRPAASIRKRSLKLLISILTKVKSQNLWETLYRLSLRQMNFGNGGDLNQSGELFAAAYIKSRLENTPSITIFDVGANVGNYSKALARIFGSKAKIYAFEPSKKTYGLFLGTTKNIASVIPHNFGFSDQASQQLLFSNEDGSGLASLYHRKLDHFGIRMDQAEEIKLSTIDNFCREQGIEKIHFLKLDIEGHELSALNGAKEMIGNDKIDFIQFEFGGCNIDSKIFFRDFYYLLKDKYQLFRILEGGLREIPAYQETQEIFITINYLAVRK